MLQVQIICRTPQPVPLSQLLTERLGSFGEGVKVMAKPNHVLVLIAEGIDAKPIALVCRKKSQAYVRVCAWEAGGGQERTGSATCVAGLAGQPLIPIARLSGEPECSNGNHAFFQSQQGLVVVQATRMLDRYRIELEQARIVDCTVAGPEKLAECEFEGDPNLFVESMDLSLDRFTTLIRAAIRKVDCQFCTHTHYEQPRGHHDVRGRR